MRYVSRVFTATAVVLSLAVLSVPAADARPQEDRTPAVHHETSWMQAAINWAFGLFGGDHQAALQTISIGGGSTTGGTYTPMTGSCIDPNGGGPRCGGI